jgi:hypothetical protein
MTVTLAVLLLVNGAFNIAVWPTFFRRVARDPRSRTANGRASKFLTVHAVIVLIALVLAALSVVFGVISLL